MRASLLSGLAGLAVALSACATTTPPPLAAAPAPAASGAERQRAQVYARVAAAAREQEARGELREALWSWRIAEAVTDSPGEARQASAALQHEIGARVTEALTEADRLRRKGPPAAARSAYLEVLKLDPHQPAARQALREMDDELTLKAIVKSGGGGPAAIVSPGPARPKG